MRPNFLIAAVLPLSTAATATQAATVLTVNVFDPNNVIFTATGAAADVNDASENVFSGVTLLDLFADDYPVFDRTQSTFLNLPDSDPPTPAGGMAYTNFSNNFNNTGIRDLNLFRIGFPVPTQTSTTDAPAFDGAASAAFPGATFTVGLTGDLVVGESEFRSTSTGTVRAPVIGQYEVIATPIPEPAAALGGATLCGLFALRRRANFTSTARA